MPARIGKIGRGGVGFSNWDSPLPEGGTHDCGAIYPLRALSPSGFGDLRKLETLSLFLSLPPSSLTNGSFFPINRLI